MKHLLTGLGIGLIFLTGWLVLLSTERVETAPDYTSVPEARASDGARLPQRVRPHDRTNPR